MNEKDLATDGRQPESWVEKTEALPSVMPSEDKANEDAAALELDLSSLSSPSEASAENSHEVVDMVAGSEALYRKTVSMMESDEVDLEHGIMLLKKAAKDGCALSWMHLAGMYSDEQSPLHNPALAFESFSGAAELGLAAGYYNRGLCYIDGFGCEKNEQAAIDSFLEGARVGSADCICALGICREFGIGCEINYEMAAGLYARAAEDNCAVAINNLGGCYFYGHGVSQNKEHAVELYAKAAELGDSNAECRLGICRETGEGCQKDSARAFEHYKNAAEAQNATALYRLALCYDKGIGTEQNFAQAFKYYDRAANAGSAEAMHEAGMMSKSGRGTKKDAAVAYRMFSAAAEAGISDAEYEVGNCYFEGSGTVRNREFAFLRYTRAYEADNTNAKAAFRLGLCNLKGLGTKKNEHQAYEWFSKGAAWGSRGATYMQGECLFYGIGVEEDKSAAAACFSRACSYEYEDMDRNVPSLLAMAQCYEKGLGVERDHGQALALYKRAAEFGDAEAMYRTGRAIMTGVGMRAEYAAARVYILRAARKGYLPAMLTMGIFADEGKGVPKNKEDAIRWYTRTVNAEIETHADIYEFPERFADNGILKSDAKVEAQYRLGMLLARHKPSTQAYISAFEYISLAASMGYDAAQTEIAKIYVHGGDLKGYYESAFSKEGACFASGDTVPDKETLAAAMNKLGDAMFDGRGMVKKNESAAARCYRTAAELGDTEACYSYGWCLRHGVGVRENDVEAVKWLKLAADRGNNNAAYSYGLCCEEGAGTGIKNKREALTYYRKAAASGHAEAAQRYVLLSERDD